MKIEVCKKIQRELAKDAGYYDGRFRPRVIEDKKKSDKKMKCRNFKYEFRNISNV